MKAISLIKIDKSELRKLVELSYYGDTEGFKSFHVKPCDYQEAVDLTMKLIKDEAADFELEYYKIETDRPIGYVVIFDKVLYSFAIEKKSRTREILIGWWDELEKLMGGVFVTVLYKNNTRAINFLIKRGMTLFEEDENKVILLKLNICQQQ